jgi:phage terminase large subunit
MDEKQVKIKYKPREQFRSFHNRKQRWSVLVCHRRAGKTVATLNDLIRGAVNECKPEGRYAFIFPQRNQAKDTAWRYLRRYAEPLLAKPPNVAPVGGASPTHSWPPRAISLRVIAS